MARTSKMIAAALAALALVLGLAACATTAPGGSGANTAAAGSAAQDAARPPAATTTAAPRKGAASGAAVPVEKPVAVEQSPPGDIPDNQAFVAFKPAGAKVEIQVPEGWPQKTMASGVEFTDKLNTIRLEWHPAPAAPTVATAKAKEVAVLARSERAFQLVRVSQVTLPAGPAVRIESQENSAPNSVTGKRYRLDAIRFELFRAGTEADLTLLSPVGADNVDPWKKVSESLKWL
jgi:hypothetical protein